MSICCLSVGCFVIIVFFFQIRRFIFCSFKKACQSNWMEWGVCIRAAAGLRGGQMSWSCVLWPIWPSSPVVFGTTTTGVLYDVNWSSSRDIPGTCFSHCIGILYCNTILTPSSKRYSGSIVVRQVREILPPVVRIGKVVRNWSDVKSFLAIEKIFATL